MMFDALPLIEKSIEYIATQYPALFGLGAFLLALIGISTIALALVLVACAVWLPWRVSVALFKLMRDIF